MFSSASHVESFLGFQVTIDGLQKSGAIERPFGKGGKFVVVFNEDLPGDKKTIEESSLSLIYVVNVLDPTRQKRNVDGLLST